MSVVADEIEAPPGEPARRKSRGEAHPLVVIALSFVTAIIVGGILIVVTNQPTRNAVRHFSASPGKVFSAAWHAVSAAYVALFEGAIFDPHTFGHGTFWHDFNPISESLYNATPLILVGLAVGLAFRTGLFNIGGQGQLILGAMAAGYVGFTWHLPPFIHLVVALIAGTIAGAVWGGIAGWLKARSGAHEVITTIMMNYIALDLLDYALKTSAFRRPGSNQAISPIVHGSARLGKLLPSPLRLNLGFLIALAAVGGVAWLLTRSRLGFTLARGRSEPDGRADSGHERRPHLRHRDVDSRRVGRPGRLRSDPRWRHELRADERRRRRARFRRHHGRTARSGETVADRLGGAAVRRSARGQRDDAEPHRDVDRPCHHRAGPGRLVHRGTSVRAGRLPAP